MARAIDRARLFVGYSQIARARAYLQPAHFHLYLDLVELAVAFLGRETRVIWPVPDQIISAQVIEHPANSAGEIVVVVDEEPAGLMGQVVQAPPGIRRISGAGLPVERPPSGRPLPPSPGGRQP